MANFSIFRWTTLACAAAITSVPSSCSSNDEVRPRCHWPLLVSAKSGEPFAAAFDDHSGAGRWLLVAGAFFVATALCTPRAAQPARINPNLGAFAGAVLATAGSCLCGLSQAPHFSIEGIRDYSTTPIFAALSILLTWAGAASMYND